MRSGSTRWARPSFAKPWSLAMLAVCFGPLHEAQALASEGRLAVAWSSTGGRGAIRALETAPPFAFQTPALATAAQCVARDAFGRVFVVSRSGGTVTVIAPDTWTPVRVYDIGASSEPLDIAVVAPDRAYITRAAATRLLRLNLETGDLQEATDLAQFADSDGVPDLGMMAHHAGRLFVQIRRANANAQGGFESPAYLAVVDAASGALVDVEPGIPGSQAITLEGTAPKLKMQIVHETRRLFVSATGDVFDAGGIEMIDLDTLHSAGLVVREADGQVGADLGAFVLVAPDRGFLTYTTDLTLSSHLAPFTITGGAGPGNLAVQVGYFVPVLAHDPRTNTLFMPEGTFGSTGVRAFDAVTGEPSSAGVIPTDGPPTDLVMVCGCNEPDCPTDAPCVVIPAAREGWLIVLAAVVLATGLCMLRTARRPV